MIVTPSNRPPTGQSQTILFCSTTGSVAVAGVSVSSNVVCSLGWGVWVGGSVGSGVGRIVAVDDGNGDGEAGISDTAVAD